MNVHEDVISCPSSGRCAYIFLFCLAGICTGPAFAEASHGVNINTASKETLMSLEGIKDALSDRIIEYRNIHQFTSIEEIGKVAGIGDPGSDSYEKIKNHITVGSSSNTGAQSEETKSEETTTSTSPRSTTDAAAGSGSSPSERRILVPVKAIDIIAPDVAYVNQPVEFNVEPVMGTDGRRIRYQWSFGDGSVATTKSPPHTYHYPGTYVAVVESYYAKETKLARREITILPAMFSLMRSPRGDIQIHNDAKYEVDLGGFTVRAEKEFTLPKYTVLLAGATLTIPRTKVEKGRGAQLPVSLYDPEDMMVAATVPGAAGAPAALVASAERTANSPAASPSKVLPATPTSAPNAEEPTVLRSETQSASAISAAEKTVPFHGKLPYLGLVGLLLLGTLGILVRR